MTRVVALVRRGGALGCALGLGETTAVGLHRPGDERALAAARGTGAARAVALWDDVLGETDYLGIAQALASLARHVGYEVVVVREGRRGVIGPAVADRLGVPHLGGVVDARIEAGRVVAHRRAGGFVRMYAAAPPVLLSVHGDLPPAADPGPVERLDLGAIGITATDLGWRKRFAPRPAPGPHALPRAFPDAASLAARLVAEGVLPARRR